MNHALKTTAAVVSWLDFIFSSIFQLRPLLISLSTLFYFHQVIDCFQLDTPPPVMSACVAPPARPDPFRTGPHPMMDLGSLTFEINTLQPPVWASRAVLQLTQEEDQAITNLLKLHHQDPIQSDMTVTAPQLDLNPIALLSHSEPTDSTSGDDVYKPLCSDVQHPRQASLQTQLQQGRCWPDTEIEAANTLLSLMEMDQIWDQNHNKSGATLPDPLPHQHQGSETLPAAVTTDCTQNSKDVSFSCVWESGEPGWGDFVFAEGRKVDNVHLPVREQDLASCLPLRLPSLFPDSEAKSRSSVSGYFTEVKEQTLSDSEGDALHVLLSLGDMGVLDIMQWYPTPSVRVLFFFATLFSLWKQLVEGSLHWLL